MVKQERLRFIVQFSQGKFAVTYFLEQGGPRSSPGLPRTTFRDDGNVVGYELPDGTATSHTRLVSI